MQTAAAVKDVEQFSKIIKSGEEWQNYSVDSARARRAEFRDSKRRLPVVWRLYAERGVDGGGGGGGSG